MRQFDGQQHPVNLDLTAGRFPEFRLWLNDPEVDGAAIFDGTYAGTVEVAVQSFLDACAVAKRTAEFPCGKYPIYSWMSGAAAASTTADSNTVTVTGAAFTSADVGRNLTVIGAGDVSRYGGYGYGSWYARIEAVLSSTQVRTVAPAPRTVSGAQAIVGGVVPHSGTRISSISDGQGDVLFEASGSGGKIFLLYDPEDATGACHHLTLEGLSFAGDGAIALWSPESRYAYTAYNTYRRCHFARNLRWYFSGNSIYGRWIECTGGQDWDTNSPSGAAGFIQIIGSLQQPGLAANMNEFSRCIFFNGTGATPMMDIEGAEELKFTECDFSNIGAGDASNRAVFDFRACIGSITFDRCWSENYAREYLVALGTAVHGVNHSTGAPLEDGAPYGVGQINFRNSGRLVMMRSENVGLILNRHYEIGSIWNNVTPFIGVCIDDTPLVAGEQHALIHYEDSGGNRTQTNPEFYVKGFTTSQVIAGPAADGGRPFSYPPIRNLGERLHGVEVRAASQQFLKFLGDTDATGYKLTAHAGSSAALSESHVGQRVKIAGAGGFGFSAHLTTIVSFAVESGTPTLTLAEPALTQVSGAAVQIVPYVNTLAGDTSIGLNYTPEAGKLVVSLQNGEVFRVNCLGSENPFTGFVSGSGTDAWNPVQLDFTNAVDSKYVSGSFTLFTGSLSGTTLTASSSVFGEEMAGHIVYVPRETSGTYRCTILEVLSSTQIRVNLSATLGSRTCQMRPEKVAPVWIDGVVEYGQEGHLQRRYAVFLTTTRMLIQGSGQWYGFYGDFRSFRFMALGRQMANASGTVSDAGFVDEVAIDYRGSEMAFQRQKTALHFPVQPVEAGITHGIAAYSDDTVAGQHATYLMGDEMPVAARSEINDAGSAFRLRVDSHGLTTGDGIVAYGTGEWSDGQHGSITVVDSNWIELPGTVVPSAMYGYSGYGKVRKIKKLKRALGFSGGLIEDWLNGSGQLWARMYAESGVTLFEYSSGDQAYLAIAPSYTNGNSDGDSGSGVAPTLLKLMNLSGTKLFAVRKDGKVEVSEIVLASGASLLGLPSAFLQGQVKLHSSFAGAYLKADGSGYLSGVAASDLAVAIKPSLGLSISDISGLQSALDAKANTSHSHSMGDVSGLSGALDGKASASHSHSGTTSSAGDPAHTHGWST